MPLEFSRRRLIGSLISLVAAPAVVRASSLMPIKPFAYDKPWSLFGDGVLVHTVPHPINSDVVTASYDISYKSVYSRIVTWEELFAQRERIKAMPPLRLNSSAPA